MIKKILFLFVFALFSATSLSSCSSDGNENNTSLIFNESSKMNLEAITALNMANSFKQTSNLTKKKKIIAEEDKEFIKEILPTIDIIFNNNFLIESTTEEGSFTINDSTYLYKETINYINENLNQSSMVLLYNLEYEPNIKELKLYSQKGHGHEDHENNEKGCSKIEEGTTVSGLAFLNEEVCYPFISTSETVIKENKTESERDLTIYIEDNNSYIKVEEENETKPNKTEKSFEYTLVNNGVIELEYSISIENKLHKDEIEYELNDIEYKVKRFFNENNELVYRIILENENEEEYVVCFIRKTDEVGLVYFEEVELW